MRPTFPIIRICDARDIPVPDGQSPAFVGYIGARPIDAGRIDHSLVFPGINPAAETLV